MRQLFLKSWTKIFLSRLLWLLSPCKPLCYFVSIFLTDWYVSLSLFCFCSLHIYSWCEHTQVVVRRTGFETEKPNLSSNMYEVNELTFLNLVSTTFKRKEKKHHPTGILLGVQERTRRVEGQVAFKYMININTNYLLQLLFDFRSIQVLSER